MKTMRRFAGMIAIAAVLLVQSGCMLMAARAVGKKVYEMVENDRAKNEQARQE